jgi:RHS repeat-associated protein
VARSDGTIVSYGADGANRRFGRSVNGVPVQGFLYQGQLRVVAELDGAGAVVSRFVYGTGVNVPDYMVRGGATYRLVTDHLGSVRLLVDATTGAVAQQLDYDPFGRVVLDTNPGFQPFGFAGGLYDPLTGLVRFGARDYDAETGRWSAKDPFGFHATDSNLYVYAFGDPADMADPDGEIVPLLAAGALVGGAIGGGLYLLTTEDPSVLGFLGSALSGAIAGAVGTVATPIAAGVGLGTGAGGTALVNAAAGVLSAAAGAGLDPCQAVTARLLLSSAAFGAVGGRVGQRFFPTRGMSVFGQKGFPRTWSGIVPAALGGTAGPNALNAISRGGATSVGVGFAGPLLVQ